MSVGATIPIGRAWPEHTEWRREAACRDTGAEVFFPTSELPDAYDRARAICRECHVADDCLSFALSIREDEGMYGGTTPAQRRRILKRRRIGR